MDIVIGLDRPNINNQTTEEIMKIVDVYLPVEISNGAINEANRL